MKSFKIRRKAKTRDKYNIVKGLARENDIGDYKNMKKNKSWEVNLAKTRKIRGF